VPCIIIVIVIIILVPGSTLLATLILH